MKNNIIIVLFLCGFYSSLLGQNTVLDSLKNELQIHTSQDSIRADLLNQISSKAFRINLEEALKYAQEAKELSDKIGFTTGSADSRKNIGFYYINKGDYNNSKKYYLEALKFYIEIDNSNRIALCYNNLGVVSQKQGNLEKSIEYHKNALAEREKMNDKYAISSSLLNIGVLNFQKGDFHKAIEYYNKVLKINNEISDTEIVCKTLNNLAVIFEQQGNLLKALDIYQKNLILYERMGDKAGVGSSLINIGVIHYMMKDSKKALEFYNRALILQEEIGNKEEIANLVTNIGLIHQEQNEYEEALPYYQKALELRQEIGEKPGIAIGYHNFGNLYFYQKKYPEAEKFYLESLSLSEKAGLKRTVCENSIMLGFLNLKTNNLSKALSYSKTAYKISNELGYVKLQKESADVLSQTLAASGRFKEAYEYQIKFKTYADSLMNESNIKEITTLQNQYDFEKEKQRIDLEQQKKITLLKEETRRQVIVRNTFIIGFIITLFFIAVIFYFYNKTKRFNQQLIDQNIIISKQKEEKELLVKEIHHRVKNNLQLISGLFDLQLKNTENNETKATLIDGLNRVKSVGLIHELLYQTEDVINIDFSDFVNKLLEHITSFSINKPIKKIVQIPEGLKFDIRTSIPLGLIVTELFTNSFKYAFNNVEVCEIKLILKQRDKNNFSLTISDNGIGLPNEDDFIKSKSLGLRLVRSLSQQLNGKIEYEFKEGAEFFLDFSLRTKHEQS